MNIIEAAKSGKRFRRKGQLDWFSLPRFEGEEYYFNFEELVADDWEVEQKMVTICDTQLEEACYAACQRSRLSGGITPFVFDEFVVLLKKELGLS